MNSLRAWEHPWRVGCRTHDGDETTADVVAMTSQCDDAQRQARTSNSRDPGTRSPDRAQGTAHCSSGKLSDQRGPSPHQPPRAKQVWSDRVFRWRRGCVRSDVSERRLTGYGFSSMSGEAHCCPGSPRRPARRDRASWSSRAPKPPSRRRRGTWGGCAQDGPRALSAGGRSSSWPEENVGGRTRRRLPKTSGKAKGVAVTRRARHGSGPIKPYLSELHRRDIEVPTPFRQVR
jgi:hypothetical protein